jgi:hypothetical protein
MKLNKSARTILGITALAWSIPVAQAAESRQPGVAQPRADSAEFMELDITARYAVASSVEGVKGVKDDLAIRK